jgi:hypothetical protein
MRDVEAAGPLLVTVEEDSHVGVSQDGAERPLPAVGETPAARCPQGGVADFRRHCRAGAAAGQARLRRPSPCLQRQRRDRGAARLGRGGAAMGGGQVGGHG